jgi:Tol biopolymer transport system component
MLVSVGCEKQYDPPIDSRPIYPILGEYMAVDWGPNGLMAVERVIKNEDPNGISHDPSSWGLYTLRDDGTDPQPLVMGRPIDFRWSPDGKWIAFTSGGLHLIRPDGTDLQRIYTNGLSPIGVSWSPDGQWILFSVISGIGINRGLWVIRPDGTGMRQLRKPPPEQMCINCGSIDSWAVNVPDWSFDGTRITYSANVYNSIPGGSQIAVYDTTLAQLNFIYKSSISLRQPKFSPDGTRIVFYTSVTAGGMLRIGLIDIDGQNLRWLPVSGTGPNWSPNGNQIIYRRYDYSSFIIDGWRAINPGKGWGDLWVFDLQTAAHRQLTFANGVWGGP